MVDQPDTQLAEQILGSEVRQPKAEELAVMIAETKVDHQAVVATLFRKHLTQSLDLANLAGVHQAFRNDHLRALSEPAFAQGLTLTNQTFEGRSQDTVNYNSAKVDFIEVATTYWQSAQSLIGHLAVCADHQTEDSQSANCFNGQQLAEQLTKTQASFSGLYPAYSRLSETDAIYQALCQRLELAAEPLVVESPDELYNQRPFPLPDYCYSLYD